MFIALHAGAGFFADAAEKYCSDALKHCIANNRRRDDQGKPNKVHNDGTACGDIGGGGGQLVDAVMFLERCAALNCGLGSNLTAAGSVECEAAYMHSRRMAYGAVAVVVQVTNCVHPIRAAKVLADPYNGGGCFCTDDSNNSPSSSAATSAGLVQPMVLAGPGADRLCASLGIGTVAHNDQLRTRDAIKEFRHATRVVALTANTTPLDILATPVNVRLDTVGGVAIDNKGQCEACVSSGGILLKKEGRIGHSAQFGAAIWAEQQQCSAAASNTSADGNKRMSVAVSVSGCGEALTRTHFAEALAQKILSMDVDDLSFVQHINRFLDSHFVHSRRLSSFPADRLLLGGLVAIQHNNNNQNDHHDDNNDEEDNDDGHDNNEGHNGHDEPHQNGDHYRRRILLLAFHNSTHFPFAFVGPDQHKVRRFKSESTKAGQFSCTLFSI